MQIDKEPVNPRSLTIKIIDNVTDEINPDREINPNRIDMTDWLQSYATNHKARLALDLEMVQANVPVESGVAPFARGSLRHGARLGPASKLQVCNVGIHSVRRS